MSGFGPGDDWDDEIDALREGMGVALETLRLYLAPLRGPASGRRRGRDDGRRPAARRVRRPCSGRVGLDGAKVGDRVVLAGTPSLAGTVEVLSPGDHRSDVVLLVDAPARDRRPRAPSANDAHASVHLALFDAPGTDAATVADRERPRWQAWFAWTERPSDDPHPRPARARRPHAARPARVARPVRPARRPAPAVRASSAPTPRSSCGSPTSTASSSPASS